MPNFTSFISEHTAEYILIPQIVHELEKNFDKVIPLYFWATREGGIMARESLHPYQYKVIAVYPRRPKIDEVGAEANLIRLNDLLFDRAKTFGEKGIPVIALTGRLPKNSAPLQPYFDKIISWLNCQCIPEKLDASV